MSRLRNLGKLRSLISGILIGALAVVVAVDCAYGQPRELAIGEQPGVVPNPRDEQQEIMSQNEAFIGEPQPERAYLGEFHSRMQPRAVRPEQNLFRPGPPHRLDE